MNLDELEQALKAISTADLPSESKERIASQVRNRAIELGKPPWYRQVSSGRLVYVGALAAAMLVIVVLFIITTPSSSVQLDPIENPDQTATALPLTATLSPTNLMIEGPVSSIEANIVTIYGITVAVPAENPVLSQIEIGDTLYIEGSANPDADGPAKFVATHVEQVSR